MGRAAFSVSQFCEEHGIGRAFFYELLTRGEGPACMKVGKRRLVSREAAAEWRALQTAKTSALEGGATSTASYSGDAA